MRGNLTAPRPHFLSDAGLWNLAAWTLALAAFGIAMLVSFHDVRNSSNELRTPAVLVLNTILASAVALGFALYTGSMKRWARVQLCFRFGFWSAAIFRLLPPILNEGDSLYLKNCGTFDAPYVILGACVHGGLTAALASPYATRVLNLSEWSEESALWELCGSVVLIFFIVAAIIRLGF